MSRVGCSSLPHCTWYTHLVLLDEETSGTGNRSRISYFWQSTVLAAEDSTGLVHHKIFHLSCSLTECATGRSNLLAIPHNQLPCPLRRTTCCWYLLGVPDLKLCERLRTNKQSLYYISTNLLRAARQQARFVQGCDIWHLFQSLQ